MSTVCMAIRWCWPLKSECILNYLLWRPICCHSFRTMRLSKTRIALISKQHNKQNLKNQVLYNQIRIGTGAGIWRKCAAEKSVSSGVAYAPSASHVISAEMSFNEPPRLSKQIYHLGLVLKQLIKHAERHQLSIVYKLSDKKRH